MPGVDFAHVQEDVNAHSRRMLEGTFLLDTAHVIYVLCGCKTMVCYGTRGRWGRVEDPDRPAVSHSLRLLLSGHRIIRNCDIYP